jgi:hypothetical protein
MEAEGMRQSEQEPEDIDGDGLQRPSSYCLDWPFSPLASSSFCIDRRLFQDRQGQVPISLRTYSPYIVQVDHTAYKFSFSGHRWSDSWQQ